jgi:molybdopterin-guanine dinucleotide biosynthesis protein A
MIDWSAAVLAGGRARRLGGVAKPLLPLGGETVLARQVAALAALGAVPRLVTSQPEPYLATGLAIVPDLVEAGALGALYTALATAETRYVLVLAGDLPFVTAPFLASLLEARHEWAAVIPAPGGRWQPLCAVYEAQVAPRLKACIDDGAWRVVDAVATLRVGVVDDAAIAAFDDDGRLLLNLNTPDDETAARRYSGESG